MTRAFRHLASTTLFLITTATFICDEFLENKCFVACVNALVRDASARTASGQEVCFHNNSVFAFVAYSLPVLQVIRALDCRKRLWTEGYTAVVMLNMGGPSTVSSRLPSSPTQLNSLLVRSQKLMTF